MVTTSQHTNFILVYTVRPFPRQGMNEKLPDEHTLKLINSLLTNAYYGCEWELGRGRQHALQIHSRICSLCL